MSILRELGMQERGDKLKETFLYTLASCYVLCEKEISDTLAPHGLSPVKMNALLVIKHIGKKRGIPQVEICKKMVVTAGNMTGLVSRLRRQKLVNRCVSSGDRRVNLIKITKKGSDLLDKVWPVYKQEVDRVVSLPRKKIVAVVGALDGLRKKSFMAQKNNE